MLILHGIYSFKPKIVAYRNDFCLNCALPRRAFKIRTFDVVHIFYVPLVPIGFLKRWHCAACNQDPHVHPGTRRSFKWAGTAVLAVFAIASWAVDDHDSFTWSMRIILPVAFVAAFVHSWRSKPDLRLADKLKEVKPADELVCPICNSALMIDNSWHCQHCGIERAVVKA